MPTHRSKSRIKPQPPPPPPVPPLIDIKMTSSRINSTSHQHGNSNGESSEKQSTRKRISEMPMSINGINGSSFPRHTKRSSLSSSTRANLGRNSSVSAKARHNVELLKKMENKKHQSLSSSKDRKDYYKSEPYGANLQLKSAESHISSLQKELDDIRFFNEIESTTYKNSPEGNRKSSSKTNERELKKLKQELRESESRNSGLIKEMEALQVEKKEFAMTKAKFISVTKEKFDEKVAKLKQSNENLLKTSDELTKLKTENDELQKFVKAKTAELLSLKQSQKDNSIRCQASEEAIEKLKISHSLELREKVEHVELLEEELANSNDSRRDMEENISKLKEELSGLKVQSESNTKSLKTKDEILRSKHGKWKKQEANLRELMATKDANLTKAQDEMKELKNEIEKYRNSHEILAEMEKKTDNDRKNHEHKVKFLSLKLNNLEGQVKELEEARDLAEERSADLQKENDTLSKNMKEIESKHQKELHETSAKFQDTISTQENEIKSLYESLAQKEDRQKKLLNQIDELQNSLNEKEDECLYLEEAIVGHESQKKELESSLQVKSKFLSNHMTELSSLRQSLNTMTAEKEELEESQRQYEASLARFKDEIQELSSTNKSMKLKSSELQAKNDLMEQTARIVRDKNQDLESKVESYQRESENKSNEIHELKERLTKTRMSLKNEQNTMAEYDVLADQVCVEMKSLREKHSTEMEKMQRLLDDKEELQSLMKIENQDYFQAIQELYFVLKDIVASQEPLMTDEYGQQQDESFSDLKRELDLIWKKAHVFSSTNSDASMSSKKDLLEKLVNVSNMVRVQCSDISEDLIKLRELSVEQKDKYTKAEREIHELKQSCQALSGSVNKLRSKQDKYISIKDRSEQHITALHSALEESNADLNALELQKNKYKHKYEIQLSKSKELEISLRKMENTEKMREKNESRDFSKDESNVTNDLYANSSVMDISGGSDEGGDSSMFSFLNAKMKKLQSAGTMDTTALTKVSPFKSADESRTHKPPTTRRKRHYHRDQQLLLNNDSSIISSSSSSSSEDVGNADYDSEDTHTLELNAIKDFMALRMKKYNIDTEDELNTSEI